MDTERFLKNIEYSKAFDLENLVEYQPGQVVSRTLAQGKTVGLTLFAFDKGEEISAHSSPGDAMVTLLDGRAEVMVGDSRHRLEKGQVIVMPAGIPHALQATERFKMLLVVVFRLE